MHAFHVVHHQCLLFGNHLACEKLKTRHQKSNCLCDSLHVLSLQKHVFLYDLVLIYDFDGMLRLRLGLSCEGAQHTEEVAMGEPSDVVHGASRYALQVV